jgi:uncharacterized protein (TIGR02270 family)
VATQALADPDPECRLAAAWSAVLLGDRAKGLEALQALALAANPPSLDALQLCVLAMEPEASRALVRRLVAQGAPLRTTVHAAAWAGDVLAIPWLIKHMADERNARLAGEAFGFITGANLAQMVLERKREPVAEDERAALPQRDDRASDDEDDTLPRPDPMAAQAWWQRRADSMPVGARCFAGAAAGEAQCEKVLRGAGQRQRHSASLLLSLMQPGTPLFNVAAPAHRQLRLLGPRA